MVKFSVVFVGLILFIGQAHWVFAQENSLPVKSISFVGNDSIKKEVLLKQMNTKALGLKDKLFFWNKYEPFSIYTFEEDLIRLRKLYQQNGYMNPSISHTLTTTKRSKKLKIEIRIKEAKAYSVSAVRFSMPDTADHQLLLDSLKKAIPLKVNQRFRDADVLLSEKILQTTFNRKGYPYAQIEKEIQLKPFLHMADVLFSITPGNKSYIGHVHLQGYSFIPQAFITKHITFKEGQEFSQNALEETQQELFDQGLFSYVTIRALMDSAVNDLIPIEIQLKELPRWSIKAGLGYGTEDKVRISLLLKRLSFLGGARSLTLKGQNSYFKPLSLDAKFIQPDIWTKNLDFILNPYFSREREESYTVDRLGVALSFQKELSEKSSAFISYAYGQDKVILKKTNLSDTELNRDALNPIKSGISIGYNINTSNHIFMPSHGWKSSILANYMGLGFNSQYHYYKLLADVSYYLPLAENLILATKLKGGLMEPTQGDVLTPIEDRFLMGGAMSLRGWGRNQISPTNSEDSKLGGNSMLEAGAELRFPLYSIFSGTAFMDVGNTWKNSFDFDLSDLHYDLGLGLRINTPVGPIRADVATPLFENIFKAQFFLTIGHAF